MTFSPRDKTLLGAGLVIVIVAVVMQLLEKVAQHRHGEPPIPSK